MSRERRFLRVPLTTRVALAHEGNTHAGRFENASLNGALVIVSDRAPVQPGDRCTLTVYSDGAEPLRVRVEVVQACFTMVGLQFTAVDADTRRKLFRLLEGASANPARLRGELEVLLSGPVSGRDES